MSCIEKLRRCLQSLALQLTSKEREEEEEKEPVYSIVILFMNVRCHARIQKYLQVSLFIELFIRVDHISRDISGPACHFPAAALRLSKWKFSLGY